jgi:hypothetical protein
MLSNIPSQHLKPSTHSLIDRTHMQIETLASRGSNYYEDLKKDEQSSNHFEGDNTIDNLNSYERLEQCKLK